MQKIKASTISNLESIIHGLKKIERRKKLAFEFHTGQLGDPQAVERLLDEVKKRINQEKYKYIYTFCLQDTSNICKIRTSYETAKKNKPAERAYARLNKHSSRYLYVGSSKGLVSRIKQHLGYGPKGTYAMQLCHWCENLSLDIVLDIYAFDNDVSDEAFQAFEDGVWDSLKPMLGRQGKK